MPGDDKKAPAYETASSRDALFAERRNSIRLKGRRDVHEPVDLKAERMKRQTSSESAASASQSGRTAEEQEELEQLNAGYVTRQPVQTEPAHVHGSVTSFAGRKDPSRASKISARCWCVVLILSTITTGTPESAAAVRTSCIKFTLRPGKTSLDSSLLIQTAPGMSSRRLESIWQPLQTPSAKVSARSKNWPNCMRTLTAKWFLSGPWASTSTPAVTGPTT